MSFNYRLYRLNVLLLFFIIIPVTVKSADTLVNIDVKTVLASQDTRFHDPRLADLIEELQSVFRYTSYRLLGHDRLSLGMQQTGTVRLPGNRMLKITPLGIRGNRSELLLVILKQKQSLFQTTIRLRNNSSITVGGPRHDKGYLLFNISNSF